MKYTFSLLFFCVTVSGGAQLVSGPMPGAVDLREARIWFQFAGEEGDELIYWPESDAAAKKSVPLKPDCAFGCTVTAVLSSLEPATAYRYHLKRNPRQQWSFRTQTLWQHRTDPPDFRLAMGSCAYINEEPYDRPGKPYGGEYEIYTSIAAAKPDVMLWLGDNVYFREVDWNTRSGMIHRYSHARRTPEISQLLPVCSHYAIWDDHDFGPNDATGSFALKDEAEAVFGKFWANPTSGVPQVEDGRGITTTFNWNDVEFFLLDNRYHRVPCDINGVESTILGDEQINWLIQELRGSYAPFKLVATGRTVPQYAGQIRELRHLRRGAQTHPRPD
jgi:alkaline phosphatase D